MNLPHVDPDDVKSMSWRGRLIIVGIFVIIIALAITSSLLEQKKLAEKIAPTAENSVRPTAH